MIEKYHNKLTVKKQSELLSLGRISFYYTPKTSPRNKLLMDRIDELFTEDPSRGTRRLRMAMKNHFDLDVRHRSKIRSLKARMGLRAIYPKVNTSRPNKAHKKYPYLLRGLKICYPNQVWSTDGIDVTISVR